MLIRLSCTVKELHHNVKITNECRLDLRMWSLFLEQWNGIPFFLDDEETSANQLQFFLGVSLRKQGCFEKVFDFGISTIFVYSI